MAKKLSAEVKALKLARRALARKNGWIQGNYRNEKGGYCAYGALEFAAEETGTNPYTLRTFIEKKVLRGRSKNIVDFNDDYRRKKSQVLALFDRAITKAQKTFGVTK